MGKHYAVEFQLQVLQPILKGKMSMREAARFYRFFSHFLGDFLNAFAVQCCGVRAGRIGVFLFC